MDNPNRRPRAKYQEENDARSGRQHTAAGWPHLSSRTGACICTAACCMGTSGCRCKACSGAGHVGCARAQRRQAAEQETAS